MLITPGVLISRSGVTLAIQPSVGVCQGVLAPQAYRVICLDILLIAELVQYRCRRPRRRGARQQRWRQGPPRRRWPGPRAGWARWSAVICGGGAAGPPGPAGRGARGGGS